MNELQPGSPIFCDGIVAGTVLKVTEEHALIDFGYYWELAEVPLDKIKPLAAGIVDGSFKRPILYGPIKPDTAPVGTRHQ